MKERVVRLENELRFNRFNKLSKGEPSFRYSRTKKISVGLGFGLTTKGAVGVI